MSQFDLACILLCAGFPAPEPDSCWIAKPEPHELEFQKKKKNHMNWGAGGVNVRIEWKVRCVIYLIFVVVGYYNVLLQ